MTFDNNFLFSKELIWSEGSTNKNLKNKTIYIDKVLNLNLLLLCDMFMNAYQKYCKPLHSFSRINSARNRRIDRILRKAFRGRPPLFEDDGDSPYEDDDYISSESDDEKTDENQTEEDKESQKNLEQIHNGSAQDSDNRVCYHRNTLKRIFLSA